MKLYTKSEIIAQMRQKRLLRESQIGIQCEEVGAIHYQDIIELYLYLSGLANWKWIDQAKKYENRQKLVQVILSLISDSLAWFWLYMRTMQLVRFLDHSSHSVRLDKKNKTGLFLRTDHWFHIRSGGSVGHLRGVIDGLRELGYQTHVVSTDYLVGIDRETDFDLCMPIYKLGRNLPELSEILYTNQLVNFIKTHWLEWKPAFIYQRYSLGNYTGVQLKHTYNVPFVCEYNGSFVWMARQWGGRKLFHEKLLNQIELLNLHAADAIVVVSQPMKTELTERGIDPAKILVNPNGVNPEQYSPQIDGRNVRIKYELEDKIVIGFIGTFGLWHGADMLAKAFGCLLQAYPDFRKNVRLLLIGDGVTMPKVKENLAYYAVEDCCVFAGLVAQEEGPLYLAACDILASPHVPNPDGTPFFGSPTKLFEYMAMGKGIVASALEQIGQVLQHKHTAWMVKPGDVDALVEGLKVLIDNPDLRGSLGQNARMEAVDNYTWRAHTQRIIEKLNERCQ